MGIVSIGGLGICYTGGIGLLSGKLALMGIADNSTDARSWPPSPISDAYMMPLFAHFPHGPLWPREDGTSLIELVRALSYSFLRPARRALELKDEVLPGRSNDMLTDWETTLGLPATGDKDNRNNTVLTKFNGAVSPTKANMTAIGTSRGYCDMEIREYSPLSVGFRSGAYSFGPDWRFHFDATRIRKDDDRDAVLSDLIDSMSPLHTSHDDIDAWNQDFADSIAGTDNIWDDDLRGACVGPGPRWVTVDLAGKGYYSDDNGKTWTQVTITASELYGVFYGGGYYIAMGDNSEIWRSADGVSWSAGTITTGGAWGSKYLTCGAYGNGRWWVAGIDQIAFTSVDDGANWELTELGTSALGWWNAVVYDDQTDLFYFAGSYNSAARVKNTFDGTVWNDSNTAPDTEGEELLQIAVAGDLQVVQSTNWVYGSRDGGLTWSSVTGIEGGGVGKLLYIPEHRTFIAWVADTAQVAHSCNLIDWCVQNGVVWGPIQLGAVVWHPMGLLLIFGLSNTELIWRQFRGGYLLLDDDNA